MDAETWDRQPFWAQRIYMEGLFAERPWDIKPSPDPKTWWSPLSPIWDNFGQLDITDSEQTLDEDKDVKSQGLPDVTAFGAPVTKIRI